MEKNEISLHQLRVFDFARSRNGWLTAEEIAKGAAIASRTARHHALLLVKLGIFDQAEVFPAHRYRYSEKAQKRNRAYVIRLTTALNVFAGRAVLSADQKAEAAITVEQIRGARGLLDWSQDILAAEAHVSPRTIRRLEINRLFTDKTIDLVREAFQSAGIEFVKDGVRLKTDAASSPRP